MTGVELAVLFVGVSVVALWVGATLFVTNAARIARRLGVPELVVGLTVVGFGTSAPELVTSVDAALVGAADIAVGNVVGSNLFNLGVVLGGLALFGSVSAAGGLARRDVPVMLGATLSLPLLFRDLRLTRVEGLVLLGALVAYLGVLVWQGGDDGESEEGSDHGERSAGVGTALTALVGLALVVAGADLLVGSAVDLSRFVGLSEWVIGETVVAVATSTPEIAASLVAARRGLRDLAAGNVVGSNVFNVLGILGVTAAIRPLSVTPAATPTVLWLVGLTALVAVLLATRERLTRLEGAVAVAVNLVRWGLDVLG
jgi:cation:H+ antiporter